MTEALSIPTLLIDEARVRRNIGRIVAKGAATNTELIPHFKTHQSISIGDWFKEFGVNSITVSSVSMAKYFADHFWNDITIAFPVNLLEIENIKELSGKVKLNLLVD